MSEIAELHAYDLQHHHHVLTPADRVRSELLSSRRKDRRRRLAERVRAVADRLDS